MNPWMSLLMMVAVIGLPIWIYLLIKLGSIMIDELSMWVAPGVGNYNYSKNYTYKPVKTPVITPKVYLFNNNDFEPYIKPNERKCPPRATFFGKLDGEVVEAIGKYEEKYLNTFEMSHWEWRKRKDKALVPLSEAKSTKPIVNSGNHEQNAEITIDTT